MRTHTRRQTLAMPAMVTGSVVASALTACGTNQGGGASDASDDATRTLRILATSDLHGKMLPWDYSLDEEARQGSMAQLASAINELRDENTILVDAGDTIQDNMADIFAAEEVHPMVACINALKYDICITGNHDYDYGMDVTRNYVASLDATVLTGNVVDEYGEALAPGLAVIERAGVRVGFIGMVTPHITLWNKANLEGCAVTNPLDETKKLIKELAKDVDVLVGVYHMGFDNQLNTPGTGVSDIANAFPEFDVIVAAHDHLLREDERINGVLIVENKNQAQTLANIELTLAREKDGWKVSNKHATAIKVGDYACDDDIMELMAAYDERAKVYAHEVIGVLEGDQLAPEYEIAGIPSAVVQDTALIDFINETQLYYSGADISSATLYTATSNLYPGEIERHQVSHIYKYSNMLYTLKMTGAQLKKYMEWSVEYYNQYQPGDLTLSFNPERHMYQYYMFSGVNYDINVAKPAGSRIENLALSDGTAVFDTDEFVVATSDYHANSQLLSYGAVFAEGEELPSLLESDVSGNIGSVRELITDYIEWVKGGRIFAQTDMNWRIVGNDWDSELRAQAVEMLANGTLSLQKAEDEHELTPAPITENDVRGHSS